MSTESDMPTIQELEAQVTTLQRRLEEAETRAMQSERARERAVIEAQITAAALECGVVPGAMPDLVARAIRSGEWRLDSQGRLLRQREGVPDVDKSGDYVTPRAWVRSLRTEASYYFADLAADLSAKAAGDAPNPWSRATWNKTQQARYLMQHGREKAEEMARAAGTTLTATQPAREG